MLRQSLALLVFAATAAAAQPTKLALNPGSSIWVEGTSNVHNWKATSTAIDAKVEIAGPVTPGANVQSVTLTLPVTSLKSGKGGLDKNLYKALNAERYPTISYRMTRFESKPDGEAFTAVVVGVLTVNGVDNEVELTTTMSTDSKGGLRAVGSTTFKMTEFGVKPVTALLGTIRTGDEVTVKFDVTGAPAGAIAQLPE